MITAQQREARRRHIGSSDIAAILNLDPYRTPADVWMEKVYETASTEDSDEIDQGNFFEGPMLEWGAGKLGVSDLEQNVSFLHSGGVLAANLDGLSRAARLLLEAKSTGLAVNWGDPGTESVPQHVTCQVWHQMACAESCGVEIVLGWVPVLLARFNRPKRELFRVEPNPEAQAAIVEVGERFWYDYVESRIKPPDSLPHLETIQRIVRRPNAVVPIEPLLVEAWEAAKAAKRIAEDNEENAKAAVLSALGNAEAGDWGHPSNWLTYFEQSRAGIDLKRLQTLRPEIAAEFAKPSTFRVARIAKRK